MGREMSFHNVAGRKIFDIEMNQNDFVLFLKNSTRQNKTGQHSTAQHRTAQNRTRNDANGKSLTWGEMPNKNRQSTTVQQSKICNIIQLEIGRKNSNFFAWPA